MVPLLHLGSDAGGPPPDKYGFDFVGTSETGGANGPAADPHFRAKSTALFVDESIKFIKTNKGRPFYLQLWTRVPHALLHPTDEQMQPYARLHPGGANFPHRSAAEIFYASVTDLDTQIGRLTKRLEELSLTDKTLIVVSSDNGPEDIHITNAGHSGVGFAGPFRGRKRSLYRLWLDTCRDHQVAGKLGDGFFCRLPGAAAFPESQPCSSALSAPFCPILHYPKWPSSPAASATTASS